MVTTLAPISDPRTSRRQDAYGYGQWNGRRGYDRPMYYEACADDERAAFDAGYLNGRLLVEARTLKQRRPNGPVPSPAMFAEFYLRTWLPLLRFCQADAHCLAIAEDVAADAFAQLWRRWGWLRDYSERSLRGWVYAAARRGLRQSWARTRREQPLTDHEAAA